MKKLNRCGCHCKVKKVKGVGDDIQSKALVAGWGELVLVDMHVEVL